MCCSWTDNETQLTYIEDWGRDLEQYTYRNLQDLSQSDQEAGVLNLRLVQCHRSRLTCQAVGAFSQSLVTQEPSFEIGLHCWRHPVKTSWSKIAGLSFCGSHCFGTGCSMGEARYLTSKGEADGSGSVWQG